jgi:hypothetical protein
VSEYIEVDLSADNLKEKNAELHKKLSIKKTGSAEKSALLGLGVSARCVFSADPAAGIWKDPGQNPRRVSDGVISKLKYIPLAKKYLADITEAVDGFRDLNYGFMSNFDDFGEKGLSSYIAIVHLDGNRMGKRIENLGRDFNFLVTIENTWSFYALFRNPVNQPQKMRWSLPWRNYLSRWRTMKVFTSFSKSTTLLAIDW